MNNDLAAPQNEFGFQEFRQILSRRKWTVFVCLAVALIGAGIASVALPAAYRVTVRLYAQPSDLTKAYGSKPPEDRVSAAPAAPDVQNQIEVLQSASILMEAFRNAQVTIPPEALDPDSKSSPVSVKEVGISDAIDFAVDLPTPEASTSVAAQIPKVFSLYLSGDTAREFARSVGFLTQRLQEEQTSLNTAVDDLSKYRQTHEDIIAVGPAAEEERTQRLSRATADYQSAQAAVADTKKRYETMLAERDKLPNHIESSTTIVNLDRIQASKVRVTDFKEKLADAKAMYTEGNPLVISAENQLKIEEDYLASLPRTENNQAEIKNPNIPIFEQDLATAKASYQGAIANEAAQQVRVDSETKLLKSFSTSEPGEEKLVNAIALHTGTVQELSRSLDEVKARTTTGRDPVSILSSTIPTQVQPAPLKYTLIAILVGLAVGVLAALAKDKLDDRVFSMDQIYGISGIPPLGQLPASNKTLALTASTARNPLLENYRALRFSLDSYAEGGEPVKSVLVASPSGLEKRNDLSFNLAAEAATDQRTTILVDADLRNPRLHEQFGARLSPGLTDVLRGTVTLEEALQTTSNSKLKFLSAGSPEEDPLELLASPKMEALHIQLKSMAEVIILNSSSLLRHADARALAKILDSVLFVARSGATKLQAIKYCVEMLRRAKAPLLGIVLSEAGGYTDVPYYGRD